MSPHDETLKKIKSDERYLKNLDWGEPRKGHPEGSVRRHIEDLTQNLTRLESKLTDEERGKLQVLIHTHDTFKADAAQGVPISDPRSHASLARQFLAEYSDDQELLFAITRHETFLWERFDVSDNRILRFAVGHPLFDPTTHNAIGRRIDIEA